MTTAAPIKDVYTWLNLPSYIADLDKAITAVTSKSHEEMVEYHAIADAYRRSNDSVSPSELQDLLNNELPYVACIVLLDGESGQLECTLDIEVDEMFSSLFEGMADQLNMSLFVDY